jgi:hypothetical protein
MFNSLHNIFGKILDSYSTMICFDLVFMSIIFVVVRVGLKFNLLKSVFISAVITSVVTVLMGLLAAGDDIFGFHETYVYIAMPFIILVMIKLSHTFGNMDDGGSVNSAERQRTLDMVEQGKITAEEGAELLEALGRSNAMLGQDKFSRLDMIILAGTAITVLGFFLPWSYIRRDMYQSGQHFGAEGWAVLIIVILAAVPVFVTPKDMLYKISMLQIFLLLLDSALVIGILFRVGSRMGVGLSICMVGLVAASFACFGKFKKLTA